jgi:ABC-type phosphate transport system substrate-binding protein
MEFPEFLPGIVFEDNLDHQTKTIPMRPLRTLILALALTLPACAFAQSSDASSRSPRQEQKYQRKTKRHHLKTADSSDLNAILKDSANAETGPILNDNGNVNSSGSIDGSRSSTGRPDADTTTSYTVKRKKTVIKKP